LRTPEHGGNGREAYCSGGMAEELMFEEIYFQPARKSESEAV
jgi:hypothetical protein